MSKLKHLNILLAEDNLDHAEMTIDALTQQGIENQVSHVENGEEAISFLLEKHGPNHSMLLCLDIVLLDIRMPKKNGFLTLKEIREKLCLKSLPVIMLTTSNNEQDIRESYKNGANSYIIKPMCFTSFKKKMLELNQYWLQVSEIPNLKNEIASL